MGIIGAHFWETSDSAVSAEYRTSRQYSEKVWDFQLLDFGLGGRGIGLWGLGEQNGDVLN